MKRVERRGGRRPGAGRKKSDNSEQSYSVRLRPSQIKLLKKWGGGDVSIGLRWLIDTAAQFIQKWQP